MQQQRYIDCKGIILEHREDVQWMSSSGTLYGSLWVVTDTRDNYRIYLWEESSFAAPHHRRFNPLNFERGLAVWSNHLGRNAEAAQDLLSRGILSHSTENWIKLICFPGEL